MRFNYPAELPISAAREQIMAAVASSQVVIVSGQTGSGKTTQIPKMLLEMGRGTHGRQIMHTQPRRIAAVSVAERISAEMGVSLGSQVGYQVRFNDESSPDTRLLVATDGILLAQIQRDPPLKRYDTIIIDEAHERSLNIDFLLGYLTALLPRRPDLKLIITSATIDDVKFREHFERALNTTVPVIEVSGRTYPVQIIYEPVDGPPALLDDAHHWDDDTPLDVPAAVARACAELVRYSNREPGARDILVFASGEHDIHDFERELRRHFGERTEDMRRPDAIEILPLFARLTAKAQHLVFEPHKHQRIVIATNVAETSLTVPGIRYVVDPGTARISRYSKTAKVQRLPIEPISQASADQRSGRCGRVADGIAIRLYSKEDYESRPRFTEPEILRTSLGAVVLHMLAVGVARTVDDIVNFGFIDSPDVRAVSDGVNELVELRAITRKRGSVQLTKIGRQLSRIPIDIRLGRMIIEAATTATPNTLAQVVVITAFLSVQDPRERPEEMRQEADRVHQRYSDATSDFLTALNLWTLVFPTGKRPGNAALRRLGRDEWLNPSRLRQWHDLVMQLRDVCRDLKFTVGQASPISPPDADMLARDIDHQAAHSLCCSWDAQSIHTSMLAGLLSMIGMQVVRQPKSSEFSGLHGAALARAKKRAQKQSLNEYLGARGTHFSIFPASSTAKGTPEWIMCAELVETSRLWARYCAAIDPAWAQPLASHLTKTTYAEPHWSGSRGSAVAKSRVLLYGLPIVGDRPVQWGRINPGQARDMLIRQGLLEGDITQRFSYDDFVERNLNVLEDARDEAMRTRQVADTANEDDLADFYDRALPEDVTSVAELAKWWRGEHDAHPHMLDFDPAKVERLSAADNVSLADFPDHWHTVATDGTPIDLKLSYVYDPSDPLDGVTIHVPIAVLSRLSASEFTWNVPGLFDEVILGFIKALPKSLRVQFVPAPDTARAIRGFIDERYTHPGTLEEQGRAVRDSDSIEDLRNVFTRAAIEVAGAQIHPDVLNDDFLDRLPGFLRPTFSVEGQTAGSVSSKPGRSHKHGRTTVLGTGKSLTLLQREFQEQASSLAREAVENRASRAGNKGNVVEAANLLHQAGATTRGRSELLWEVALSRLELKEQRISSRWLGDEALMLASAPYASTSELVADLQLAAVKRLLPNIANVKDDDALALEISRVGNVYEDTVYAVSRDVVTILKRYAEIDRMVSGPADLPMLAVLQSIRAHIASLVAPGFIGATLPEYLPRIERYLMADQMRLNKAKVDKDRDVRWAWQADEARKLVSAAQQRAFSAPPGPKREELMNKAEQGRWMIQEFFVSLWAQELGTAAPVSIERLRKLVA